MNRFRFRLASVLRYRRILEDNKKRELGDALNNLQAEQQKYDSIVDDINQNDDHAATYVGRPLNVQELQLNAQYSQHLESRKKNQDQQVQTAGTVVNSKRLELGEAVKHRKILDRLKERQQESHEHAAAKEEQSLVDDLMVQRFTSDDSD